MNGVLRVERGERRWAVVPLVAAVLGIGGLAVSWLHLDRLSFTMCFFKATTGIPCMTCGTTLAVARLATLDLAGALQVNPLATSVFIGLGAYAVVDLALLIRGRRLAVSIGSGYLRWLLVLGAVLVLANWAYLIWAGV